MLYQLQWWLTKLYHEGTYIYSLYFWLVLLNKIFFCYHTQPITLQTRSGVKLNFSAHSSIVIPCCMISGSICSRSSSSLVTPHKFRLFFSKLTAILWGTENASLASVGVIDKSILWYLAGWVISHHRIMHTAAQESVIQLEATNWPVVSKLPPYWA